MARHAARIIAALLAGYLLAVVGLAEAEPKTGARLVEDINPGPARSLPAGFGVVDEPSALFSAFEPEHGRELWRSDRPYRSSATGLLKDINPGPGGSFPSSPARAGRSLFFAADNGTAGLELWKSDGTAEGTVLVKDINPGPQRSFPFQLTDVGGTLFFIADHESYGLELWKSDGTAEGTVLVKDIVPGPEQSFSHELTNVDGTLFFSAAADGYSELWKSDGTAEGTVRVKDINPGPAHSDPTFLTSVAGTLYFLANDGTHGPELWKSDGIAAGTVLVKDLNPGPGGSLPSGLTEFGGVLYFVATEPEHGRELWRSDGTPAGTVLVKDFTAGTGSSFPPGPFFVNDVSIAGVGKTLFVVAAEPEHGRELWRSDGTPDGTVLVKDINPGPANAIPPRPANPTGVLSANLTDVDGTLLFRALDGDHGLEPWISDGTAAGTTLVEDIYPGPTDSTPENFTNIDGTALFSATDNCILGRPPTCNTELWTTTLPSG